MTGDLPAEGGGGANPQSTGVKPSRWLVLAGILALVGVGVWWGPFKPEDGGALDRAIETGVIRIGYAVEAPYAFLDEAGHVTGESVEVARYVAGKLGIPKIEWRLTEFCDLIEGLESGRYDLIAAGMFITPERAKRVAFSVPTFQVAAGLLVRVGNPADLHSYEDLVQHPSAIVAVLTESEEERSLIDMGFPERRLLRVPDAAAGRAAVHSGVADALALSALTIRWMYARSGPIATQMASPFSQSRTGPVPLSMGGFAFRKEDRRLLEAWNSALLPYVGTEAHLGLVEPFGFTRECLPGSAGRLGEANGQ